MHSHSFFRKVLCIALIGVSLCVFGEQLAQAAGINRQINYQGRLLTSGGSSVSNGTYLMKFSIYDAASGGNALWTAAGSTSTPSTVNVTVQNGLFSIQLGDTDAGQNPFAFDFHQDSIYLGVTVASDTEMLPRKRLTSVPYAFVAETLQGQYASSSVLSTGGNLFALHQNGANSATGDRSALFVQTSGTSNVFDYLIKGNSGSDVFTVSRQGHVTTTGNFASAGNAILGDSSADTVVINAHISSDIVPTTDATYSLGSPSLRWLSLNAVNVSSTNVTTTNISVNGQTVCLANGTNCPTSTVPTFHQVTTAGNTTTNAIIFGGGTSTNPFDTSALIVSGGDAIGNFAGFQTKLLITSPNESYWSEIYQNLNADALNPTSTAQWGHYVSDSGELSIWSVQGENGPIHEFLNFLTPEQLAAFNFPNPDENWGVFLSTTGSVFAPFEGNSNDLGVPYSAWRNVYASGTQSSFNGLTMNRSTSTNATTTNLFFGNASGSSLFVTGQAVCLANGTNCPSSGGVETLLTVTNRGSVATATVTLFGGATISNLTVTGTTSLQGTTFTNATGTSATTTNLFTTNLVGTYATTSWLDVGSLIGNTGRIKITNSNFDCGGALVACIRTDTGSLALSSGNGSGLYLNIDNIGSSINAYGDFLPDGANTRSLGSLTLPWRNLFAANVSSTSVTTTSLTFNTATGSSLFVSGDINNIITADTAFPTLGSLSFGGGADPLRVSVVGKYAYVANSGANTVAVVDVTNPASPFQVGAASFADTPLVNEVFATGKYAYAITADAGTESFSIVDVSNASNPVRVATTTLVQTGSAPQGVYVSGKYAYVVSDLSNTLHVIDISSASSAPIVSTTTIPNGPSRVIVQGRYAYTINSGDGMFNVVDVGNPNSPVIRGTLLPSSPGNSFGLAVSGRYAYTVGYGSDALNIIDISNPSAPVQVATSTLDGGGDAWDVVVSGRYAFVSERDTDLIAVVDIAVPTAPVHVTSISVAPGSTPVGMAIAGRYLYVTTLNDTLKIIDIGGTEVSGLAAATAEIGSLQVLTNGSIANQLVVGGGLSVGGAGIFTAGSIGVYATNTTSTFSGPVTIQGQAVCLANGSNCQSGSNRADFWSYDVATDTLAPATRTSDVLIGGATQDTSAFTFLTSNTSSRLYVGAYGSSTDIVLGGPSSTVTNTAFQLNGGNLFVNNNIGSASSVYTNGAFIAGPGSTMYGDGFVNKTNGAFTINSTSGDLSLRTITSGNIVLDPFVGGTATTTIGGSASDTIQFVARANSSLLPAVDMAYTIGTSTLRWFGLDAANVTSTNIVTDNLTVNSSITVSTTAPTFIGNTNNNGYIHTPTDSGIAISGKYAYVPSRSSNTGRFAIVDISNPGSATSVGVMDAEFFSGVTYSSVVISGKYAYVGATNGFISIIDISNPSAPARTNPAQSGYFNPASLVGLQDLAGSGKYLYGVGNNVSTFNIIDTASSTQSNSVSKNQLSIVATYVSSTAFGTARGIVAQGPYVYVAADNQLTIMDVSNPATTTVKGMVRDTTNLNNSRYAAIQGKRLYVAANNRLTIMDVSNASAPTTVGSFVDATNLAGANHVAVVGNTVYVTASTNHKVVAINVANPAAPNLLGVYTDSVNMNTPSGIAISGNRAYVAHGSGAGNSGLAVLGISGYEMSSLTVGSIDATNIRTGENVDIGGTLNVRGGISADGGGILTTGGLGVLGTATSTINGKLNLTRGLLVDGGSIVHALNVNPIESTQTVSSTVTFFRTRVAGRYLYAMRQSNTFAVYDITTTSTINQVGQVVSSTALSSSVPDFAISGKYAYAVAGLTRFTILDISDPQAPTILSSTSTANGPLTSMQKIEVQGRYAFITHSGGAGNANVSVWDVSNPFAPKVVNIITYGARFGGTSMSSAIEGNRLYVGGNSPAIFTVVDITNPLTATTTGIASVGVGPNGLAARGKWVYSQQNGSNFQVIDVSSSTNPVASTCTGVGSNATPIAIAGNYAYVATQGGASNGIAVVDISNPGSGTCSVASQQDVTASVVPTFITLAGRRVFLSSSTGLHVVTLNGIDASVATIGSIYGDSINLAGNITVNGQGSFTDGINVMREIVGSTLIMRDSGTSTFNGVVSTTQLYVGNQLVCLADGTNCPVVAGSSNTTWSYNTSTDTLYPASSTSDVLIGGASTTNAAFWFNTTNTSSRLYVGAYGSSTDIVLGASTSSISNTAFQLTGGNLFVNANIGSASSVYTNGAFIAGPGSTLFGDGYITRTTGDITFSASSGVLRPATNNSLSLGSVTSSFANIYSSGTIQFVNASGSSLELNHATNLTAVSTLPISGSVRGTAVSGRYAYIANTSATSGLVVADIADPKYPSVAATVNLETAINDIVIQGSYAYLGSELGLHVVDIRNPSSPSSVGFLSVGNSAVGVAVSGKYAYVVADTQLTVIDISHPKNPQFVTSLNVGSTIYARVTVQGAYLYAVDDTDGIQIFDIVDPTHPVLLDSVGGAGDVHSGVYVSGKYLYLAAGSEGIQIVDISNPYDANQESVTLTSGGAGDVSIAGKLAYIADGTFFTVFDVSSSTAPTTVASIPLNNSLEVTVSGKYAYVGRIGQWTVVDLQGADIASANIGTLQSNQLTVLDTLDVGNTASIRNSLSVGTGGIFSAGPIRAPALDMNAPQLIPQASYTQSGGGLVLAGSIAVAGNYGYVGMNDGGMQILDLTRPDTITPLGTWASVSSIGQVAVSGRYAYAIDSTISHDGFTVIDVLNPSAPTTTAHIGNGLTDPSGLYVSGKYAYVAVTNGLAIIDISNPSSPYILSTGSATPTGFANDVYVDKGYAYVAKETGGMSIFDVSNPAAVTSVGAIFTASGTRSVVVSDGYAYLAKRNGKLEVVNVSNPASPTLVGSFTLGLDLLRDMVIAGRYVYVQGTVGIYIVDVLNPTSPTSVAQLPISGAGRGLAVSGRTLYSVGLDGDAFVRSYDLGGADIANASIGSLQSGEASVDTNLTVGNDLNVRNGLRVGTGGIYTDGTIAAAGLTLNAFTAVTTVAAVVPGGSFDADTVDIQGKYAYITDAGSVAFRVFDITQPTAPTSVSVTTIGSSGGEMEVAGRYAYILNVSTFDVVDVSNPSSPRLVGSMSSASSINGGLAISGNYAYVAASGQGVKVVDISDPTTPTTTGIARNFSNPQTIRVQGRYAYVFDAGTTNAFKIVDTSSSTAPIVTGILPIAFTTGLAVQGKYAYTLDSTAMKVIDVSNPAAPVQIATSTHHSDSGSTDLILYGNYAIAALASDGIEIFDISNPAAPTSVKYMPDVANGRHCEQLRVVGRYLYGACTEGFFTFDLGGASLTALDVGSVNAGEIYVARDVSIGNDLEVGGGITAGLNGIHTDGELSGRNVRAVLNNGFATGTAGLFYKSVAASSLSVGGFQTGIVSYTTGTNGSFDDLPSINAFTFGGGVQSASAFVVNGFEPVGAVSGSNAPALLAIDMTSSTAGGAILAARECGSQPTVNIVKFATDTDTSRFTFRCSGQFFADNGTVGSPADYAEYFPTADTSLTVGEVVVMTSDTASSVKRSMAGDRESIVGVISEHPLVLGNAGPDGANENNPYYKIVGLLGQLPVKASSINGPIMAGDKVMAGDDGYAVKATGVGSVIGQALENLATATGSIKVYVKPEWSGDGIFDAAENATKIVSQGTATSASMAFDSYGLSFQGSVWDGASSTAISSSFTLVNDVISVTSSVFRIQGSFGNSLLTVSDIGDVGVAGDLTVGHRLFLGSKALGMGSTSTYLFVDDTQAPTSTYIATNADGWSTATTYDYAERFPSIDELQPGDLVVVDPHDINHVKKTTAATDLVMGIVSTKPGFITGAYSTGTFPIALAGRVPTRVSTANGPIMAGDELAPSDVPGVAVKATTSGPTVGIALESYLGGEEGKISVFVKPGWKVDVASLVPAAQGVSPRSGLAKLAAGATSVDVSFASVNAYPLITVTPYGLPTGEWGITNVTDHGFTLTLSHAESFDLVFSWKAEPSGSSPMMSFSDGTSAPYDPLTGQSAGAPSQPPEEAGGTDPGTTSTDPTP